MELLVSDVPVRGVSRRTVVSGLAWSVPVIAIAGTAPAVAASTSTVVPVLQGTAAVTSGTVRADSGGYGYDSSGFTCMGDANSTTANTILTASYSASVVAGTTYQISFAVRMGYCNPSSSTQRLNLSVDAILGSTTNLALVGLKHSGVNSNAKLVTDANMTGYTLISNSATATSFTRTIRAAATGVLTIRYMFTLVARPTGSWGNDDIWITAPVVTRSA